MGIDNVLLGLGVNSLLFALIDLPFPGDQWGTRRKNPSILINQLGEKSFVVDGA